LPVDYSTTVLTERLQQVINNIDAGASNGFMRLLDAGGNTLSSFQLSRPMGVAALGVLTFNGLSIIDPAAAASGVAATARVEDSAGTVVIHGLLVNVGSSTTSDIFLSPSATITAGQTVVLTAATITGN
jgi:predicted nicotinamide N-methyase